MQYISSSLQKAQLIRSLYHDWLIHRSIPPFSQCVCMSLQARPDRLKKRVAKRLGCGQANDVTLWTAAVMHKVISFTESELKVEAFPYIYQRSKGYIYIRV